MDVRISRSVVASMLSIYIILAFTSRTASGAEPIIEVDIVAIGNVFYIIHSFFHWVACFIFDVRRLLVIHEGLSVSPSYCSNDIFFANV